MGIYTVDCPTCGKPTLWFSGSLDQRCSDCKEKEDYANSAHDSREEK